jgi:hypothetical protein
MIFGSGRVAFLEFLRNLSPQIMLLTIALVLSTRLDLTHFVWTSQGLKNGIPFTATLIVFLGALTANATLFFEKAATSSRQMKKVEKLVRKKFRGRKFALIRALLWAAVKYNRSSLLQAYAAIFVVYIGLTSIFFSAIPAVASALRILQIR